MSFMVSSSRTMAGAHRIAQERMRSVEIERRATEPQQVSPPIETVPEIPSDALALQMLRRRHMPLWAIEIVVDVARAHHVALVDLIGSTRVRKVVAARNEAIYRVKSAKPLTSFPTLGMWFDRDHTSALFAAASYQESTCAPVLTRYNVNRTRRRNAAVAAYERKRAKERRS